MKKRVFARLMYISACAALLTALLLGFFSRGNALLLFPQGSPEESADSFFRALEGGDYAAASALCSPALSAEKRSEETDAALVYDALCVSRHWEGSESSSRSGSTATVTGRFTVLDTEALTSGLKEEVTAQLQQRVAAARENAEVYTEDGSYRDEVVMDAWYSALRQRLSHAEDYYVTRNLTLTLHYRSGQWLIESNEELLLALSGGAA